MPACEMCGKDAFVVIADIEGVELKVCEDCSEYGVIKRRNFTPKFNPLLKSSSPEPSFKVVVNYSELIRKVRDVRNLNQENFAKLLNERESALAKWEQGSLKPDVDVAKKIGKILGINLVEKESLAEDKIEIKKTKADEFTLGDFIKVRKRN